MGAGARFVHAVEALEQVRQLVFGDAHPGIAHLQHDLTAFHALAHADLAFEGELEGIRKQVEHDLLPLLAVHVDRLGQGRQIGRQRQAGLFHRRTEDAHQPGRQFGQVCSLEGHPLAAGLELREVQQGVHQLQQPQGVVARPLHLRAHGGRHAVLHLQGFLQRPEDQRQRGAELVADVAEELGLHPVELGQRLCAAALFFQRVHIGDGGR